MKTLKITGKAVLKGKPDTFVISFPVEELRADHIDAMQRLNKKVEKLREVLVRNNLDPLLLKTDSFSIGKETKWNSNRGEDIFLGYKASHSASIELPINQELMNRLLGDLSTQKLDIEFKIKFVMKDSAAFIDELIEKAIENAKHIAGIITKSSGVTLKEIVSIDYSFGEISFLDDHSEMCIREDSPFSLPNIEPKYVEAEKTITLTWSLE